MAVNETKVTKIFVGSTAPTVNKNLIWCDTSKNYQLKKFIGTLNGVDQWKVLAASEASAITIEENGQKYILQDYVLALATELDNKANASELNNYLKKIGDAHLELGYKNTDYDSQAKSPAKLTVGGGYRYDDDFNFVEWWDRFTEITDLGICISGEPSSESPDIDEISLNRSTGITIFGNVWNSQTLINYNTIAIGDSNRNENGIYEITNPVFKVHTDDGITGTFIDTNLATELEDGHIASSKAIKSYVDTSVSNKANKSDLSNYLPTSGGTISSNAHSALTIDVTGQNGGNVNGGLTVNSSYADWSTPDGDKRTDTTHYGASSITGDAVTSSIISGSNKLLTSGGAYTALQNKADKSELTNKQDKLSFYSEDTSSYSPSLEIGNGSTSTKIMSTDVMGDVQSIALISEFGMIKINTANELILDARSISGSAIAHTISSNSSTIPTSNAVYTALQNKADNTNVVHLSGDEVITGNKLFTSSIKFSSFIPDTFNTNLAGVSVPDFGNPGTPPTLIIDRSSNITIDASNMTDSGLNYEYIAYGIISGVNWHGETFRIDGKHGSASFSSLNVGSISGSAVVSTLGTSTTSSKLPTEGAVVKAISDVKTSLGSALTYEGSVENYSNLPTGLTASDKGKVYNVVNANGDIPAGTNYAWNGTSWDALGGELSAYQLKTDDSLTTTSKQIVGAINELNLKIDITTGPTPITSVYTVDSTVLEAFITDTQYANIQGRITISPSIDNTGAIYFGQSITDKSQAFPLYPGQIMSFSFTDINTFMCATDTVGNKFNYVVEFGVVNKEPVMDYGIIIRSATGENYRLTPITDENGVPTLELESLAKIDSEQLAKYFEESTPNVKELTLVNGSEESQTVLQDKQGNILYTV